MLGCRVPELAGLLDADTAFPAGVWAEEANLSALLAAGLQQTVGPQALVSVARSVEAVATTDAASAVARCVFRQRSMPWDMMTAPLP